MLKNKFFMFLFFAIIIFSFYNFASAESFNFTNPLGTVSSFSQLLNKLLTSLKSIVITIAIIFIVIGGIFYMTSSGDPKKAERAKAIWTASVIGLAIVLAAPAFLREIITIMGGSSGLDTSGLAGPSLLEIAVRVLTFLLSIVGIIAIISLVVAGIMYLTAYGDPKKIDTAKAMVFNSILGIIVTLGALVIIRQVATLIGG